jgi:antitoxin (DNA-binding transcriptional repressor) of toxin-antitoxin stability system
MRAVRSKALGNQLGEYVRLAAGGDRVLIVDGDRVVAEIVPPECSRGESVSDAVLADTLRPSLITPPTIRSLSPPPRAPVARLATILAELDEDRSDPI